MTFTSTIIKSHRLKSGNENIPRDSSGRSLVVSSEPEGKELGYHNPDFVKHIPETFLQEYDDRDPETPEQLLSNYVRCLIHSSR